MEIITKDSLDKSIEFISEIDFNEEDYEKIFEKFKPIFKNLKIKEKLENITGVDKIDEQFSIKTLMKIIMESMSLNDLNLLTKKIVKNEDLTDFIEDLFLEKLF